VSVPTIALVPVRELPPSDRKGCIPSGASPAPRQNKLPSRSRGKIAVNGAGKCNSRKSCKGRLRFHAPPLPPPPVIAGAPLSGAPIDFIAFLYDDACQDVCRLLFGAGTAADQMLEEFRKATEFHFFGHRRGQLGPRSRNPGRLNATKATQKEMLRRFVHRAYRGDPYRRGVKFWGRIAALLWDAHHKLMALRKRAERARLAEIKRIEKIPAMRAKRATYMRRYRKRRRR
jgi:hypothetical protein